MSIKPISISHNELLKSLHQERLKRNANIQPAPVPAAQPLGQSKGSVWRLLGEVHFEARAKRANIHTVPRSSIPASTTVQSAGQVSYANQFLRDVHFEARAKRETIPYPSPRAPSAPRPRSMTLRDLEERDLRERYEVSSEPLPPLPRDRTITLQDLEERMELEESSRVEKVSFIEPLPSPIRSSRRGQVVTMRKIRALNEVDRQSPKERADRILTETFLKRRPTKDAKKMPYVTVTISNNEVICVHAKGRSEKYLRPRKGAIPELLNKIEKNDQAGIQKVAIEIIDGLYLLGPAYHSGVVLNVPQIDEEELAELGIDKRFNLLYENYATIFQELNLQEIFIDQLMHIDGHLIRCTDIYQCDDLLYQLDWKKSSAPSTQATESYDTAVVSKFRECEDKTLLILAKANSNISTKDNREKALAELGIEKAKKPLLYAFGLILLERCALIKAGSIPSSQSSAKTETSLESKAC